MTHDPQPTLRPDFFAQLAATDPFHGRARRLFERGQVLAVNGNQADVRVGYDAHNNPLDLKEVPIVSGYVPRVGDWVSIQYEAGHSGAPWISGPSMAADDSQDSPGIGVFSVSSAAPPDPQRSTIYFDESRSIWRGWDGSDWVDLSAKLHNLLPDLQGGQASEYYHLEASAHAALHDLYDGDGMASAYVKRLKFKAIDASATQRTCLFEKDGDLFWAINATYNEATGQWNRIDTTKYAYLIALYSKNNIPTEPIGGVVWWRCTPGSNPIGDWAAVGGWELGYMMTEHRNFVMGGMNLEMDGSGSPPYGRFTQVGSEDTGNVVTAMQRNSWYEGSGSWARDSANKNSAIIGFDANADLFVWWYPDSSEGNAPWQTSAWQQRAKFNLSGSIRGRLDLIRSSSETAIASVSFLAKHKTSADMADGFGAGYSFAIQDNAGVENIIAACYALRDGADNTGKLSWQIASAGVLAERMSLTAAGRLVLGSGTATRRLNVYDTVPVVALFQGSGGVGAVDVRASSGNVLARFYNIATGIGWETGQNAAAGAPLTNAFCWSLSQGLIFSDIRMSLSTAGVLNIIGSYQVDGDQVVTNRQPAIASIADISGTANDGTARAKINDILAMLRTHGLIAT